MLPESFFLIHLGGTDTPAQITSDSYKNGGRQGETSRALNWLSNCMSVTVIFNGMFGLIIREDYKFTEWGPF